MRRAEPTPKERAYECLKEWIIYSELKPGTLLNERELAERFGISRTPLREILQRLSYQRLIVIRPRKGIFVAPIDFYTVRDIFEARLPLERSAAALAAERATPELVAELEALVAAMRRAQAAGDFQGHIRLDQVFHETLAKATGNDVLADMLEDLHNICLRFWRLSRKTGAERYGGIDELEQVCAAVTSGRASDAAQLLGVHVLSFLTVFDESSARLLSLGE